MARLLHRLRQGQFAVTVEIDPPKGASVMKTLEKVRRFADRVDAVNVADCPMANVRMSPITLAHLLQRDVQVEAIFHLTCRDRNVIGLQAELLGAAGLGVRNILALRGDPPTRGDHPDAKGVFETDAVGLIRVAHTLNQGQTVAGGKLDFGTDFAIGCAANPTAPDLELEVSRLEEKVAAGAHFVQTQPIYDALLLERWLAKIEGRVRIPILYGILPLKNYEFAVHLNQNVPGIVVPDRVVEQMRVGGDGEGIRQTAELLRLIAPMIHGIHIFPMNSSERVLGVLAALDELGVPHGNLPLGKEA
ncbi:MAG: putative 5,10-methylenetetrahydrofolate reductase [Symbiobacteriaceae bacterium]|jgi:5,10-methylenetetrahydrofolate reductase|nr:putative 5,10-methylenetetrahydrofolate reductase [Symbiobacteriaceae bacterium]